MSQSYPCSLSDEEWALIEPLLNQGLYRNTGVKPKYSRRDMLNAIFYLLKTGCQWRELPNDFPPWPAVYSQFRRWKNRELFLQINQQLRRSLRKALGRREETLRGIADSQSIKTTEKKGSVDLMEVKKLRAGKDTYWSITLDS